MAATNKPMSKSQILAHFSDKFGITRKQAGEVLNEVVELAISQTKKVGVFVLPGLGKLSKVKRKARMGRNPMTGEAIKIPAKTVAKMSLAKACKEAIVGAKK